MTSETALPAIDTQLGKVKMENNNQFERSTDNFLKDQGDNLLQEPVLSGQGKKNCNHIHWFNLSLYRKSHIVFKIYK